MSKISFSSFNQRKISHLNQKNKTVINCSKGLVSPVEPLSFASLSVNNLQFISSLFTCVWHMKKLFLHPGTDNLKQFYSTIIFPIIGLLGKRKAVTCILAKVVKLLPHKEILRFLSHFPDSRMMVRKSVVYRLIAEAILQSKDSISQSDVFIVFVPHAAN